MPTIPRPRRLIALALLVTVLIVALVYRSTVAAQSDAVVVLSTVLDTPVLSWTVNQLTDEPRVQDVVVAGTTSTLIRPSGSGPWPVIVFVNGATPHGRRHPQVQRLARGLARAGYVVLVPELPGLADGEITIRTLAATVAVADYAASREDARGGRVGLVGVSVGASLALVAAEDPALADRVSVVVGIAPYADLVNVLRLATADVYEDDGKLVAYETDNYLTLVAARSLIASLAAGRDRSRLLAALPEIDEADEDPPAVVADIDVSAGEKLGRPARAVVALLLNRDPHRFESLYAALPASIRAANAALSPIVAAERLRAPVEIAAPPRDKYFPLAESRALARAAPNVRITVTETLAHAVPEPTPGDIAGLFRFNAFVVRSLQRTAAAD